MIEILKTRHSKELLCELSSLCFNKLVYKELGYPIFSDNNHNWFLAYKNGKLIGFCAAIELKNKVKFCHDYIEFNERKKGYYKILFSERFNIYKHKNIEAVCTNKSIKTFKNFGFIETKKTKNYTFVKFN